MKTLLAGLAVIALAAGSATAAPTAQQDKMKACAAQWNAKKAAKTTGKETYAEFTKTCLSPGPAAAAATQQDKMKACGDKWTAMKKAGTTGKQTYAEFSKTCPKG
jgi:hypothetical protein